MNERDFDKLFQDKIGDELPFDFQPADWQKVSRALDEVLPNTPLVTPESVALTAVKKVGWWAVAAATALVGTNLWLIYQLSETKREVATLQTTKAQAVQANQNTQIVVVRDTVYQTIYANAPAIPQTYSPNSQKFLNPKILKKDNEILENQSFVKNNFNNLSKIVPLTEAPKNAAERSAIARNNDNRATPPPPQYGQENMPPLDFGNEANAANQPIYATVAEKYAVILKNAKSSDKQNIENNIENKLLVNNNLDILAINRLRKLTYKVENLSSYELSDYLTKSPIKPLQKSKMPLVSGWALGVHKSWLFNQPTFRKAPNVQGNVGATIAADVGREWRFSASFDYWHEYKRHIDSADRQNVPEPPAPDYRFEFMEIESPLAQVRVGLDYYLPRFGTNNFFIGIGLAKQWLTNPEEKYVFKNRSPQPNPQPQQPQFKDIEQRGSDKNIQNFALLRLGTEGSLYGGLGWTANVYSQWALKDFKDQTWGGQLGVQYRF